MSLLFFQATTFTFQIAHTSTPHQLIVQFLTKRANRQLSKVEEKPSDFCLKVCGQEEYLIGNYPLINFIYIQECLSRDVTPVIVVVNSNTIDIDNNNNNDIKLTPTTLTLRSNNKNKRESAWKIKDKFKFNVNNISRLNSDAEQRTVEIVLQAGLFYGGKSLCESQKTKERIVNAAGNCEWDDEILSFDICICDIPHNARLCFVLYEISKSSKGTGGRRLIKDPKQEYFMNPLSWVNTTVYDFKSQFKNGPITLFTWAYVEDIQNEDLLNPLGAVVSNSRINCAASIELTFPNLNNNNKTVEYPSFDKIIAYAKVLRENKLIIKNNNNNNNNNSSNSNNHNDDVNDNYDSENSSSLYNEIIINRDDTKQKLIIEKINNDDNPNKLQQFEKIKLLAERDPLHELHEQERKTIWAMRTHISHQIPTLLSKLLHCFEWNDHEDVAEATLLVSTWPKLPVEKALELLDYAYADRTVRSFAVSCIKDISDDDLSLYLLQLVQALKHENYLYCDLTEFLLRRALNNQRIGHFLFWHLRSEMHVKSVSIRFGLILEAYCRGCQKHIIKLQRQVAFLDILKSSSEQVKLKKDRKNALLGLNDHLKDSYYETSLTNILCPIEPGIRLKKIKIDKCRIMDSKMRPLWLVFENSDPFGDDVFIILKHGDDLRQDMLTLQMLRIMDKLWKREGLDFRMNPYHCISTENKVGMIEVVLEADTIANIQKEKGIFTATSAFRKESLLSWLKDRNDSEMSLNKAILEFTLSCVGYSVATYVLGIADRHSDNIMLKKNGQLFHIDFGHILGHFKEKFGIRRERVPFVLTNDFVHVINKGQTGKGQVKEFQQFQDYCERAFLILRKHGSFILSLFAMMISTGLPELSSEKDLNYLRDTLVLSMTEDEAKKHFRKKFDEALCKSWKTSLNWTSHNMAKNNKVT